MPYKYECSADPTAAASAAFAIGLQQLELAALRLIETSRLATPEDVFRVLDQHDCMIEQICNDYFVTETRRATLTLHDACNAETDGDLGLPTGLTAIDGKTGILIPGHLTLVACEDVRDAAALALQIGANVAHKGPFHVVHLSNGKLALEPQLSHASLLLASREQFPQTSDGCLSGPANRFHLVAGDDLTPLQVKALARRIAQEQRVLGLVIVASLDSFHSSARTCNVLGWLGKELMCAVAVVCSTEVLRGLKEQPWRDPTIPAPIVVELMVSGERRSPEMGTLQATLVVSKVGQIASKVTLNVETLMSFNG